MDDLAQISKCEGSKGEHKPDKSTLPDLNF